MTESAVVVRLVRLRTELLKDLQAMKDRSVELAELAAAPMSRDQLRLAARAEEIHRVNPAIVESIEQLLAHLAHAIELARSRSLREAGPRASGSPEHRSSVGSRGAAS